jgi:hypothetical protein
LAFVAKSLPYNPNILGRFQPFRKAETTTAETLFRLRVAGI